MACPKIDYNAVTEKNGIPIPPSSRFTAQNNNADSSPAEILSTGALIEAIQKLLTTLKDNNYKTNLIENDQMKTRYNFGLNAANLQGNALQMQALATGAMGTAMIGGAVIGIVGSVASIGVSALQGVAIAKVSLSRAGEEIASTNSGQLAGGAEGAAPRVGAQSGSATEIRQVVDRGAAPMNANQRAERLESMNKMYGNISQSINTIAQSGNGGAQGIGQKQSEAYTSNQGYVTAAAGAADTQKQTMDSQQKATNSTENSQVQSFNSSMQSVQTVLNTIVSSSQGTR